MDLLERRQAEARGFLARQGTFFEGATATKGHAPRQESLDLIESPKEQKRLLVREIALVVRVCQNLRRRDSPDAPVLLLLSSAAQSTGAEQLKIEGEVGFDLRRGEVGTRERDGPEA